MEGIQEKLRGAVRNLFGIDVEPIVTVAPGNTGADYASNVAMRLAKLVHKAPMVVAEMIKAELADGEFVVEIAQPGFLNFTVNEEMVLAKVKRYAQDFDKEVKNDSYAGKTIVVEFSDPNPFKVLHVGHLYTSIVGDSISRILECAGGDVVRANFGGDVGLHVSKTLYSVLLTCLGEDEFSSAIALSNFASQNSDAGRHFAKEDTSSFVSDSYSISDSPVRALGMSNTVRLRASNLPSISSKISSSLEICNEDSAHSQQLNGAGENKYILSQTTASGGAEEHEGENYSEQSNQTEKEKIDENFGNVDELLGKLTIEDIAKHYVEGTRAYEENEEAKAEITRLNKEIYRINGEDLHDSALAKFYWRGRELSYQYFDKFYERIGVKFDKYYPESSVADRGMHEVKAHTGTTYEESDGAIVYHGEKVGLHTRVFINREGVPTYETKDVGLIFTKWDDWHFDESIVITGNEQSDYMKVVLASVSEYAPQLVDRTKHYTHGMVRLEGNTKMSSRKGNFLKAVDVLKLVSDQLKREDEDSFSERSTSSDSPVRGGSMSNTASLRASNLPCTSSQITSSDGVEKQLKENSGTSSERDKLNGADENGEENYSKQSNETEEREIASDVDERVLLAAIKYAFLKYKMGGDIIFDPKESVSTTGNSGIYLLYSVVRAKKILLKRVERKSELSEEQLIEEKIAEKELGKKIVQYQDVLSEVVRDKAPYKICSYLYELAQEFSRFYEKVRVAGNPRESELREVVQAYINVMEHGLGLLGVSAPDEM